MSDKIKIVCKKEFTNNDIRFEVGRTYNYWTNFGGLNHIVEDHNKNTFPFSGDVSDYPDDRPSVWEYFTTIEDWRHNQINKISFVNYITTFDKSDDVH